ncbi:MAG: (2Fe-2S) ferredoxin domain-containing protein, partial [Oscillospiraceae bacterium]|nr:(2Fe-2S) ferredoxin domain-containing protein [Oscillospiraceae bacterium]
MSMRIAVGQGSCGIAAGAHRVASALLPLLVGSDVALSTVGCIGMCWLEPIVDLYEDEKLLARLVKVHTRDTEAIANAALSGDLSGIEALRITPEDSAFLEQQTRIALRNCGIIDPESIESA